MYTQNQAMQKGDFIYIISKSIPKDKRHGKLRINIHHKTKPITDVLMITWHCNPLDTDNHNWEDASLEWEYRDFCLLPLLNQLANLPFTKESTFEQIIDMLHQNEIEQGLFAEVKDKEEQLIYSCYLSKSEIMAGSFIRYNPRREFIIQEKQQQQLIEELEFDKIISLHLLLSLAK